MVGPDKWKTGDKAKAKKYFWPTLVAFLVLITGAVLFFGSAFYLDDPVLTGSQFGAWTWISLITMSVLLYIYRREMELSKELSRNITGEPEKVFESIKAMLKGSGATVKTTDGIPFTNGILEGIGVYMDDLQFSVLFVKETDRLVNVQIRPINDQTKDIIYSTAQAIDSIHP